MASKNIYICIRLKFTKLFHHETGRNVHGLEFLAEELKGVGQVDLGDLGLVPAGLAFKGALAKVCDGHHSTEVADKDAVGVGDVKEAFL